MILSVVVCGIPACGFKFGNASRQTDSQTTTAEKSVNQTPEISALARKKKNSSDMKTGTYRFEEGSNSGDLTVEELGNNRLKVNLAANYEYKTGGEWMANSGGAAGTVTLNGNTAILVPEDFKDCEIKMTFVDFDTVSVKQKGTDSDCGFGASVTVEGIYKRIITDDEPPGNNATSSQNGDLDVAVVEKKAVDLYRLRFQPGKYSGEVRGTIRFKQAITYIVGAKKGQWMSVKLMDLPVGKDITFRLLGPGGVEPMGREEFRNDWGGQVPASGDYQIQLSTTEDIADYKLFVVIE